MSKPLYHIVISENSGHGGLFEFQAEKWFDIIEQTTGEVMMTFQQHYEDGTEGGFYDGVENVILAANGKTVQFTYHGSDELHTIELPV